MDTTKVRFRKVQLNLRLTENEKEYIDDRAKSVNMTTTAFARKMMIDGAIIYRDAQLYSKCMKELNKIGTNINQIAHNTNSVGQTLPNDMAQLKQQYERFTQLYIELLGEMT